MAAVQAQSSADALTLRLDNIEDSLAAALSLLRSLTNNSASRPRQVRRAAAAAAAAASPEVLETLAAARKFAAPPKSDKPAPWPSTTGQCTVTADACLCSRGCPSTWGCQPSFLCSDPGGVRSPIYLASQRPRGVVPVLIYLTFSIKHVRNKYSAAPWRAYRREFNRVAHFLETARASNLSLPVYVVAGGDRNATAEAELIKRGAAAVIEGPLVAPPRWSSTFHKHSFNRIGALALTQFEKVVVMDNDMALFADIAELAAAPTPAVVWHSASVTPKELRSQEDCAVTGGMFVFRPEKAEYDRAIAHLHGMYNGTTSRRFKYDGSDQEFFRSFYALDGRTLFELPIRYHATSYLKMPAAEWRKVAVMHGISGFRNFDGRLPTFIRKRIHHYK